MISTGPDCRHPRDGVAGNPKGAYISSFMRARRSSLVTAALLAAASAGLLAAGFATDRPLSSTPRVRVAGGGATLKGSPVGEGVRLPVGAVLRVKREGAGVTVLQGDGTSFTLSGGGAIAYAGRTGRGHGYRLGYGKLFCRPGDPDARLRLSCQLADLEAHGGLFQVFATAQAGGAAYDSPRALDLRVARGTVMLTARGGGEEAVCVPAGIAARLVDGSRRVRFLGPLSADQWKAMTGSAPAFAAEDLACADIPAGAWVRRRPGSRGPTPGSQSGAVMFYSAARKGGVLLTGSGGRRQGWLYSAMEDRWRRLSANDLEGLEPGPRTLSPEMPAGCIWSASAYSPAAKRHLLYGMTAKEPGTWEHGDADGAWRLLEPPANPVPRREAALYYDAAANLFVLFGGRAGEGERDDLWVFRMGR